MTPKDGKHPGINVAPRYPKVEPLRWARPFSLAVTKGIVFTFFSSAELYA